MVAATLTINIAFKSPDALVFATDGLASVMDVAEDGSERFLSNMRNVEKLVTLREHTTLAMFNGVGSLGAGTVASTLLEFDRSREGRKKGMPFADYVGALIATLEDVAHHNLGALPVPFHLIVGAFEQGEPNIWCVKWSDPKVKATPERVLQERLGDQELHHYGVHYAGATASVARFVEGYDPGLPQRLALLLCGQGEEGSFPGLLELLIHEARRSGPSAAAPLSNAAAQELALKYARKILGGAFDRAAPERLSEHFSLQAAIDYCVFLAQCAYAQENLSPSRNGPPRVGSSLQVAFLRDGKPAHHLVSIKLGVRLQGVGEEVRQ